MPIQFKRRNMVPDCTHPIWVYESVRQYEIRDCDKDFRTAYFSGGVRFFRVSHTKCISTGKTSDWRVRAFKPRNFAAEIIQDGFKTKKEAIEWINREFIELDNPYQA